MYYVTVRLPCGREEVQTTMGVFLCSKGRPRLREGECRKEDTCEASYSGFGVCRGWVIEEMRKARPMRRARQCPAT